MDASVTPIIEDEQVVGYTSVRVQAARDAIERAERAYADIREGRNKRLYLDNGRLRQKGVFNRLARVRFDTIRAKLTGMIVVAGLLLIVSGGLGLYGLNASGERLGQLNNDGLRDVIRLQQIDQTIAQTRQTMIEPERMDLINTRFEMGESIEASTAEVAAVWQEYYSRDVNKTELATEFNQQLQTFFTKWHGASGECASGGRDLPSFHRPGCGHRCDEQRWPRLVRHGQPDDCPETTSS
ncbi:hypothetical protein HSBAA_02010 [Vreelandella sulfidaeris]|uniref:Chemotaxis methyl-accepting receptor Tar-related ligand-binding domain-containing protein n=1 Tax=Vreelandella sulfidaeris TaxID=115553 RepID=A0A455TZX4_9GAMM|nr:hypothetical protein HSBAA_02010 [Halomonas sulfidaeris]